MHANFRERFLASGDDADLPIVDAHHHFWDLRRNYYPWLQNYPRIPFRYGDYESICQDFLPEDYFAQLGKHRVVKTVMMEAEWDPNDPLGEARWVSELNASTGFPDALSAQIWLDREDVNEVLSSYRKSPLVRAVRHKPRTVTREAYTPNLSLPGGMRCDTWRAGYSLLSDANLMFELQAPWWHLPEAADLARDFPSVVIIINHTALPADRSEEGLLRWRQALALVAEYPNVHLKLSGLGEPGKRWSVARNGRVVRDAITCFGVDRCMFASNFPVDRLVVGLDELYTGFKAMVAHLTPEERLALFHDNAVKLYGLT